MLTGIKHAGIGIKIQGHLKIVEYKNQRDYNNQQPNRVVLNKRNAVHKDNASILIIKAITDRDIGNIAYMVFGNGGTNIDSSGNVIFLTPNDTGLDADLYNPIFFQLVDDSLGALAGNQMAIRHIANSLFTDVEIRCLVGASEPFGQLLSNQVSGINYNTTPFVFDEIGLKLSDGTLLTHVIFSPVLKTASSLLEVVYTLRIAVKQPLLPHFDRTVEMFGTETGTELGVFTEGITQALEIVGVSTIPLMSSNTLELPGLTNTKTNTVIYVASPAGVNGFPIISVTSSPSSLVFTQRGSLTDGTQLSELWTATSAGILTNEIISINYTGDVFPAYLSAIAVSVSTVTDLLDPFDANLSMPASTLTAPTITGISTTNADDIILCFFDVFGDGTPETVSGFTEITSIIQDTGPHFDCAGAWYMKVTAPQSSISVSLSDSGGILVPSIFIDAVKINP